MVKVNIAGIQISLMSQHRVVLLKDSEQDRYLPIWIGPCEAEAINIELQNIEVARPLTHDLLLSTIQALGGEVQQIIVSDLRDDTFYARIMIAVNGREIDIDARPSDAMALAVRVNAPIYVSDEVMAEAGITPEEDLSGSKPSAPPADDMASAFDDFIDTLDIDDMPIQ